jgi:3,4-dihydroxy 2-butanone 4-phosphate synthase/GTP cyclohydrolase II
LTHPAQTHYLNSEFDLSLRPRPMQLDRPKLVRQVRELSLQGLLGARADDAVLVRVHSECMTGEVFGSQRCDCGEQLDAALKMIDDEGCGVLLYMRQEGRGIGLKNKIKAYELQDEEGLDTVEANERLGFPADLRDYGVGAQILADLGVRRMRLITNNPGKRAGIEGYGLEIVERVALEIEPNEKNLDYLRTKKEKLGHILHLMS